jgi:hypothetical protein
MRAYTTCTSLPPFGRKEALRRVNVHDPKYLLSWKQIRESNPLSLGYGPSEETVSLICVADTGFEHRDLRLMRPTSYHCSNPL